MLQLYPYKLQLLQQLLPDDSAKQMAFAKQDLLEFEENLQWLLSFLSTNESHFSLHGTVNKHICRIYANHHAYTEEPLQLPQVSVC